MNAIGDNSRVGTSLTSQQRRQKRKEKRRKSAAINEPAGINLSPSSTSAIVKNKQDHSADQKFVKLLSQNEDALLNFVAKVNRVYEEKLKKPAPFMTFILCGMQSAGKSTVMERFMCAVLNIVQQGTGTRCPLDTTCIHDDRFEESKCGLRGEELSGGSDDLTVDEVFTLVSTHNRKLADEDRFSTKPLYLTFRSKTVQNMRFVDTPGIISNRSDTGKDNRDEIMDIIRNELRRANTRLCVLLEATEFSKNPIINFLDEDLGARANWIKDATFLMPKFDKQISDTRSASNANDFFREFHANQCFPHLITTPTLVKEDLEVEKLLEERKTMLDIADSHERTFFENWKRGHEDLRAEFNDNIHLSDQITTRLGFLSAKEVMRQIMLEDTARRLPEVLDSLRIELDNRRKEKSALVEKLKFHDVKELKLVVSTMLSDIESRLKNYLDGDLESSLKFPDRLQTLNDEIEEEDESEWSQRDLNFYSEREEEWRNNIADMEGEYPDEIQADAQFLGGKQFQRAIELFRTVMVESLPDPYTLKELVPNITGYLNGGLQTENWERATVEIIRVCLKDVSHPGINYLIKHVGHIFRRLFRLALDDIKKGEKFSATFKILPAGLERELYNYFDSFLWELMQESADKTHCMLEPIYSTVDPGLPTFHSLTLADINEIDEDSNPVWGKIKEKISSTFRGADEAKKFLKRESRDRALSKSSFLPAERTAMITKDETLEILRRSFEYMVALMEFVLVNLRFLLNHYMFLGFKERTKVKFFEIMCNLDWEKLTEKDEYVAKRFQEVEDEINSLIEALHEVEGINCRFQ